MWKQWGTERGFGCDPVHNRRVYAAQSHFDSHLMHDDFARTLDARQARLCGYTGLPPLSQPVVA